MGTNNKQRRAAKKRRKQRASRPSPRPQTRGRGEAPDPPHRPPPGPEELLRAAVDSWARAPIRFRQLVEALAEQRQPALRAAEAMLDAELARAWERGWAPAELVHALARQLTAAHAGVAVGHVVADGRRRVEQGQPLHRRWRQQLASLEDREPSGDTTRGDARLRHVVEVLCVVGRLPSLPRTVLPPGATGVDQPDAATLDPRMLARVRALLAKAESTRFEEEAEAFMAKAQELIARHAIDEALLHTVDDVGEPSIRRVLIDDPYADAKAHLVGAVASANRCRVVYTADFGWATTFGYEHDLDAVELLATSLLAQATAAMVRHGPVRDITGRSRTRSFRRAFLLGFAQRIGERLREATDGQVVATTQASSRLVPVLAAREDRLRAAVEQVFPQLERLGASASNASGWYAGQAAAESARLDIPSHSLPDS